MAEDYIWIKCSLNAKCLKSVCPVVAVEEQEEHLGSSISLSLSLCTLHILKITGEKPVHIKSLDWDWIFLQACSCLTQVVMPQPTAAASMSNQTSLRL